MLKTISILALLSGVAFAEQPQTTQRGATFTIADGWSAKKEGVRVMLAGPEKDLRVTVVETRAKTAEAAVAEAWGPAFKRPLRLTAPRPGRQGWDERRVFAYETSPNEKLVVYAVAFRKGNDWTLITVEGAEATFEKRVTQIALVGDSLRPKGYTRETFAGKTPHPLDAARIKKITDFIEKALEDSGTPGVAISLVQNGKTVFEGGFGVRELGKPDKVDADTLFLIASNTKAMTTLMLAKLVDEGKLTWEQPVTTAYPAFKLGDAATTKQVLLKHLVCACTGLPRQDFEWLFDFQTATPKSEMALLATMQPTSRFGEVFQYSNLLASAAGFVGGFVLWPDRELGAAYDEAMQTRVFTPLGMKSTTFQFQKALANNNHASPHSENIDGRPALTAMDLNYAVAPLRPAGGAWSNVRDVDRYLQMELAKGKLPDGKQYISEERLSSRRAPLIKQSEDQTYGMGLSIDVQYGIPMVHHGGSLFGYKSDMFFLPDHNIGGVLLANADAGGMLTRPFIRKTLEVLFDGREEAEEDLAGIVKQRRAAIAKERERLVVPPDPTAFAQLSTRYKSPALGEITVLAKGADRIFDFGEWRSSVASRKNDDGTTSFVTTDPGVSGFVFVAGKKTLTLRDAQHEYVFTAID